jgi:sodium transport system permease protein
VRIEPISVIFRKEIFDNLRDRRTLTGSLFYPLLGPLLIILLFTVMGRTFSSRAGQPLALPVVGAENGPGLVQFLQQREAETEPPPEDPEACLHAGDCDAVLVIPQGYEENLTAGRPATVRLLVDPSRQAASIPADRTRDLLDEYSRQVVSQRLLARGVDPAIMEAVTIEEVDVSTSQSRAASFLYIMPFFIVMAVFIGAMYLVIDTTAGERERGSLEPLLINPVTRGELVVGKLMAALPFAVFALIETLLGFFVTLRVTPLDLLDLQVSLPFSAWIMIFLITLPMTLLTTALQMIIATFTRSFKEAQTYLSLMPLAPALPGMLMIFAPVKAKLWMMLIPTFGQQLLINQAMRGEALPPLHLMASAATTIVAGMALVLVAVKLYQREHILFG